MSAISSFTQLQPSTAFPRLQGRPAAAPQAGAAGPSSVVSLSTAGLASALADSGAPAAISTALRYKGQAAGLLHTLASGAAGKLADAALPDTPDNRFALSVLTASGRKAELVLADAGGELFVRVDADPELSAAEREALAGLARGFQDAIDGLALVPPKVRLAELARFGHPLLQSVDLQARVTLPGDPPERQSLKLHIDAQRRTLAIDGPRGAIAIGIDTSRPELLGTPEQQSRAIDNYLKQFEQAARRGHGDPQLAMMFKDGFSDLSRTSSRAPQVRVQPGAERAVMTGMADFEASITASSRHDNPARREEVTGFHYALSQATQVEEKGARRSLVQVQEARLKASFHEALSKDAPLAFDFRSETQNYRYHEIDDSARSSVALGYMEGSLQAARLEQSVSQSERVRTYVLGRLKSDTTMPERHTLVRDLMQALASWQPTSAPLDALGEEVGLLGTRLELGARDARLEA